MRQKKGGPLPAPAPRHIMPAFCRGVLFHDIQTGVVHKLSAGEPQKVGLCSGSLPLPVKKVQDDTVHPLCGRSALYTSNLFPFIRRRKLY